MQQSARARYGTSTDAAITTLKLIIGPGDEVEPMSLSCPTKTNQAGFPAPSPWPLG